MDNRRRHGTRYQSQRLCSLGPESFFLSESQEEHIAAGPAHTAGALQAALALLKEEELIVRVQFV